jgi:hypothetical protein
METGSGGYLDVVKTYKRNNSLKYRKLFFEDNSLSSLPSNTENGFYLTYERKGSIGQHSIPIYLNISKNYTAQEIIMEWTIQGSDDGYRCNHGNWVPLNGPGFNSNYNGYKAPILQGYDNIQGQTELSRDTPLEKINYSETNIPTKRVYLWSG